MDMDNNIIWVLILAGLLPFIIIFLVTFLRLFPVYFKEFIKKGVNEKTLKNVFQHALKENKKPFKQSQKKERNINILTAKLVEIINQIDNETSELSENINIRQQALNDLVSKNKELSKQEQLLRTKISILKETPIEVAEYFEEINDKSINRNSNKSFLINALFFLLGIIASIIIALLTNK